MKFDNSHTKKLIKGSSVFFVATIVATIIGYVLRIYLARELSIEEFGMFYSVIAFLAFFQIFRELGLNQAIVRFLPEFLVKKDYKSVKSSVAITILFQSVFMISAFLFILIFSEQIAAFIYPGMPAAAEVLVLLALSMVFSVFFVLFQVILQGFQKINTFSMVEPIRIISVSVITIILISMGAIGVSYAHITGAIIASVIFMFPVISALKKLEARTELSTDLTKKLFSFAGPVIIGSISLATVSYIDTVIITLFRSISEVGLYQVALPTSQILWVVSASVAGVFFPLVSKLYASKKYDELSDTLSFVVTGILFLVVPLSIIVFSFPEIALATIFGHSFIIASDALRILTIGAIFYSMYFVMQTTLYGIGKSKLNMKILIIMALVTLILDLIFVPIIGIIGAAAVNSTSYLIGLLLSVHFLKKHIEIRISWYRIAKIFTGGILTSLIILAVKAMIVTDIVALELVISLLTGIVFYILYIIGTKSLTKKDIRKIEEIGLRIPKFVYKFFYMILRD